MTTPDGLLRDAGGARPTSDVDALIERLQGFNPPDRTIASQRDYSQAIHDAAAALVQLRDENARVEATLNERHQAWRGMVARAVEYYSRLAAERIAALEAERADLIKINNKWVPRARPCNAAGDRGIQSCADDEHG
jgi:hypothetical protein